LLNGGSQRHAIMSELEPHFGIRGASWFLGVSEWAICVLLFIGFWNKKLGILGAIGSAGTFIATVTIIPFMPNGWAESAGGFPAMAGNVPFLMKDVVLLAVSLYLLKQDIVRASAEIEPKQISSVTTANVLDIAESDPPGFY
jgi:uncharacterized membrane protein YkgB